MTETSLENLVKEALNVLKIAKERFKRVYVTFSGGKDSLVALDLSTRVFNPKEMKIIFNEVTGNTDKCNIDYVYRIHEKYYNRYELLHLRPYMDFFEAMIKNGVPNIKARWCMNKYKIQPLRNILPPYYVMGIKKTDSNKRSQLYSSHIVKIEWEYKRVVILPLLNWTTKDVLEYIRETGLELSPCYQRYGHSGNCMFCPFHTKKQATLTLQDPYWRNKIITALKQIRSLHDDKNKSKFKKQMLRYWLNNLVLHNNKLDYYVEPIKKRGEGK